MNFQTRKMNHHILKIVLCCFKKFHSLLKYKSSVYSYLLSGFGGSTSGLLGGGGLDDTDGNGLSHVPDSEPSEGRVLTEGLNAHGLAGDQGHDGGIARLDELGV